MANTDRNLYPDIPAEKFVFTNNRSDSDEKFKTKQIGYFGDAWHRFRKNKSSIAATWIILLLILYAIVAPMIGSNSSSKNKYPGFANVILCPPHFQLLTLDSRL